MADDISTIKEILNIHLDNIRGEIARVAASQEKQNAIIQDIVKDSIERRKDIEALKTNQAITNQEMDAVKKRFEIHEDVQVAKWNEQTKKWEEQAIVNNNQENRNKAIDKKENINIGLLITAITTSIGIIVQQFWKQIFH